MPTFLYDPNVIQAIANIASVIVAIVAIVIAFRVERRGQKLAQSQLTLQKDIGAASVKPLLAIHTVGYKNRRAIKLRNDGLGPSIITGYKIEKGEQTTSNIAEIIDLEEPVIWNTFWRFSGQPLLISAGDSRNLLELSYDHLISQGIAEPDAMKLLDNLRDEIAKLKLTFEYEDILGNTQKSCVFYGRDGHL